MQDNPFSIFNVNEFKKWISENGDKEEVNLTGLHVESKFNNKKMSSVIDVLNGEENKVIKEFCSYGGVVKEVIGNNLIIKTKKGTFEVHKMYVEI
jgi:hypothetical protein